MQPQTPIPPEPETPAPRRTQRRLLVVVASIVGAAVLVAGGLLVFLNDRDQFTAEPPACEFVGPSLHLLGAAYIARPDTPASCDLLAPKDHPLQAELGDTPVMKVVFRVADSGETDEVLEQIESDGTVEHRRLEGVGDLAYLRGNDIYLRVSNLVVGILVFPMAQTTQDQAIAFATDLAGRLRAAP
jgi:hypothetical protein